MSTKSEKWFLISWCDTLTYETSTFSHTFSNDTLPAWNDDVSVTDLIQSSNKWILFGPRNNWFSGMQGLRICEIHTSEFHIPSFEVMGH